MERLDRLESAVMQMTRIIVEQSERADAGFKAVRGEIQGVREEIQGVREEIQGVREEVQSTCEALSERLDRLIAVTMKERTSGVERLADLERRVARLEEHAGF
jgi:hypothetical protein